MARRLTAASQQGDLPDGVQVGDYGTSGMHLAYDLADHGYDTTILVDAAPRGETPGTLTVLEIRPEDRADLASAGGPQLFNGHGMQPEVVLGVLDMLGAEPGRILVVALRARVGRTRNGPVRPGRGGHRPSRRPGHPPGGRAHRGRPHQERRLRLMRGWSYVPWHTG